MPLSSRIHVGTIMLEAMLAQWMATMDREEDTGLHPLDVELLTPVAAKLQEALDQLTELGIPGAAPGGNDA
jgi:hypothetical protein